MTTLIERLDSDLLHADSMALTPSDALPARFDRTGLHGLSLGDQELFEVFGRGPNERPRFSTIHEAFDAWAVAQPDAVALEHEGATMTYGELQGHANQLAVELRSLGVTPRSNVALFTERSIPMVVGILASLKVGAAYVPQHVGVAPEKQLRHVLEQTEAPVVLTLDKFVDRVPANQDVSVIAVDKWIANQQAPTRSNDASAEAGTSPDDNCFVLFTSGTTGPPNGVQVTHRNVCNILATSPGDLGMRPGLRVAQLLSISFDMAAWETLGALMNGATLLLRGKDIQATAERADVVIATPSILGSIDASRCTGVSVAAVAGEPCPKPLADLWGSFCTFYNSCGPTETTIVNTAQHYQPAAGHLTIGKPTPNNTVYVLDENRRPVPIGEVGEMWAGGDCVTAGYLKNAELTGERYAADPFLGGDHKMFRTRDLGRWTASGELEHFGRTDDQVKVRGFRVELDSVSTVLETSETCTAAVTIKFDDRTLVSFVQPLSVNTTDARNAVAAALPYYAVPASVTALPELPRTPRGKVDKRTLLAMAQDCVEKPVEATA